jgi:hypothetical protein
MPLSLLGKRGAEGLQNWEESRESQQEVFSEIFQGIRYPETFLGHCKDFGFSLVDVGTCFNIFQVTLTSF